MYTIFWENFKNNCKKIIDDYNNVSITKKTLPKVGIVGEILIKYHTFGNDNLVGKLEQEGAEVFVPELMGFVKYCAYNNIIRERLLKKGKKVSVGSKVVLHIIDYYEKTVRDLLKDDEKKALETIKTS